MTCKYSVVNNCNHLKFTEALGEQTPEKLIDDVFVRRKQIETICLNYVRAINVSAWLRLSLRTMTCLW